LSLVAPRDYIYKNDWLFVGLGNNEINKIFDQSSIKQDQNHSYVVIYEYPNSDQTILSSTPTPTKSKIVDNIIYFQAVKNHEIDTQLDGKYSIYYGQDYLKYIHATPYTEVGKQKYSYIELPEETSKSYDNSQSIPRLYDATPSSIDLYQTNLSSKSNGYYKLAFFNDGIDWKDSISQKIGAKAVANFSGPNIKLHAKTGPSYGKVKIRIISRQEKSSDTETVVVDWTEIDCFSLNEQESVIYTKTNLEYKDYNIEIEVLEDKNILSTGNIVSISKITFLKNMYIELGQQELSTELVFTSIGGIR